jgi:plastocyanin
VDFTTAGAPSDTGELRNTTATRTFPTAGSFAYRCSIHTTMTGVVRVH